MLCDPGSRSLLQSSNSSRVKEQLLLLIRQKNDFVPEIQKQRYKGRILLEWQLKWDYLQ